MENFTIHIFGYGETQINSKDLSVKVKTDSLKNVTPLIDGIFAKKPADNNAVITEFHAINLFNYNDVRWTSKQGFDVKNDADLKPLIDNLIAELQTAKDNQPIPTVKAEKTK
ncbi:MAG: hypothetical protein WCJ62_12750 [Flavobacterium sp.]